MDLRPSPIGRTAFFALLCLLLSSSLAFAATISIINVDGAGEGFNDNTPTVPVGGNNGTTRGAQRLRVFQRAAEIWGSILPSAVEIRVEAKFDPLSCSPTGGVLGFAGALAAEMNFPNAPFSSTWYHVALASKLAGADRDVSTNDIQSTFNSVLDSDPNCLGGAGWYYGFDGNEGTHVDLLPVVLHELAHGLGFGTFTSLDTGAFLGGQPDVFARFILDTQSGKHWNQMTASERQLSAVNTGNVVWDGPSTTLASPHLLGPRPIVVVSTPAPIAGTYAAGTASFGPQSFDITGDVVLVNDGGAPITDACTPILNDVNGKIAFIDRGSCIFTAKAQAAQDAGAIAAIIANNVSGPVPPGLGGADPGITIPIMSITLADGATIRAQLGSTTVRLSMRFDASHRAGADDQGHVFLYSPNPLQPGSSISHFDISLTPNALMEPAINRDLVAGAIDLTRSHFQDIGWDPATPVALEDLRAEATGDGVELHWRAVDGQFTGFDVLRARMHPRPGEYELRNPGRRDLGNGSISWVDREVESATTYAYRIVGFLQDGTTLGAGPVLVNVAAPEAAALTVWPNPMRGSDATMRYALPRRAAVTLRIFDLAGRQIREVTHGSQAAGLHAARWDGRDDAGRRVANGVYLARLATGAENVTRRIAVLR